jgi:hypothetical protein
VAAELGSEACGGIQIETVTHHAASMTRFDTDNKDFEQKLCDVIMVCVSIPINNNIII